MGLCTDIKLGESSLDSNSPQDCEEGQTSDVKNLEKQQKQSGYLIAHSNIQEQERAKETQNLIEGCPESCVRKGTEQEKTGAATGEDVDKNWTLETKKAENDRRNSDWLKDGGDKFY
ncbi:hypothetical protein NDU88_001026 [Pleurodeles waltl]|uniref:Uncharacterized protein n=1 Tax=Pleurodeles waltl TaxID=8319 RepID=A0AAV7LAB4_PLEWA|nr:hypothetical protein NDU88_001026 [Pleurodeles waltl]